MTAPEGYFSQGRRKTVAPSDDLSVSASEPVSADPHRALLDLYDRALPQVYGYLRPRCATVAEAEDLTAEVFLAAVRRPPPELSIAWLVTVARHKLVDHWRSDERVRRGQAALALETATVEDPWEAQLDVTRAREVLSSMGGHHRAVLSLRYLDGLPVAAVAEHMGRTPHATEALLVRARQAFRRAYEEGEEDA